MKYILMVVAIMGVASSLPSGQAKDNQAEVAPQKTMEGCHGLPWEAKQSDWNVGQVLSPHLKKEDLIKALHPKTNIAANSNQMEVVVGIGAKPWRYLSDAQIVVLETDVRAKNNFGGTDSLYRNLSIAIITTSPSSSTFTIVAKTKDPFRLKEGSQFNKYDLAPYRLSEAEYGFGLRECVISTGTGFIESFESLNLFKLSDSNIARVLSTPIYYENAPLRGGGEGVKEIATISISSMKTNGYFNLIKNAGKNKSAVFYWDGKVYKTEDKDPFRSF